MSKKKQFQNKYILVTGASSGIGFQIAKDFLSEGAFVGVQYCNNMNGAKRVLKYSKNKKRTFSVRGSTNISRASCLFKICSQRPVKS